MRKFLGDDGRGAARVTMDGALSRRTHVVDLTVSVLRPPCTQVTSALVQKTSPRIASFIVPLPFDCRSLQEQLRTTQTMTTIMTTTCSKSTTTTSMMTITIGWAAQLPSSFWQLEV